MPKRVRIARSFEGNKISRQTGDWFLGKGQQKPKLHYVDEVTKISLCGDAPFYEWIASNVTKKCGVCQGILNSFDRHCNIDGCDGSPYALGLCRRHYRKHRVYGNANIVFETGEMWLRRHSNYQGDDCLKWPFCNNDFGYGVLTVNNKTNVASRFMCEITHGSPPNSKMHAAHDCGQGRNGCVNPKHLRWATAKENSADNIRLGTRIRGERCKHSILNEEQVREIRSLRGVMSKKDLAEKFGVAQHTIYQVQAGTNWKHVS